MSFKLISWNVRGLGRGEKRAAVKRMGTESKPGMLFIQESKLEIINDSLRR